jgi:hypothetical protein
MAQVMALLIQAAEAWSDLNTVDMTSREAMKLEVLGSLVQLLSRRFHGFREVPTAHDLQLDVRDSGITLKVRSPGRVPLTSEVVERQLAKHGFVTERTPGTENRELVVRWAREHCATVIELPRDRVAAARRRRLR